MKGKVEIEFDYETDDYHKLSVMFKALDKATTDRIRQAGADIRAITITYNDSDDKPFMVEVPVGAKVAE